MAKTFDLNVIKGIKLVDKSGKVKDEAVKERLGDQDLFRFKDGIVWAKPFKLNVPAQPQYSRIIISRNSTKRSLAKTGAILDMNNANVNKEPQEVDIYYDDTLSIRGESTFEAYTPPTVSLSATTVRGDVQANIEAGTHKSYTLTMPKVPENVESYTVTRYKFGVHDDANTEVFSGNTEEQQKTIYHSDELQATAISKRGYAGSFVILSPNNINDKNILSKVVSNVGATVLNPSLLSTNYILSVLPAGVDKVVATRTLSPIAGITGDFNEITKDDKTYKSAKVYMDDVISYSWVTTEGYNEPTFNQPNPLTIQLPNNNFSLTATSGGVKRFRLSVAELPLWILSATVTRTSSPLANASIGELKDGDYIYYNDVLSVTAVTDSDFEPPTILPSSNIVVKGDVNVVVQQGANKTATLTIPPLIADITSCTFTIAPKSGETFKVNATNTQQTINVGLGATVWIDAVYPSGENEGRVGYTDSNGNTYFADNFKFKGNTTIYYRLAEVTHGTPVPNDGTYVDTIYFNTTKSKEYVENLAKEICVPNSGNISYFFASESTPQMQLYFENNGGIINIKGAFVLGSSVVTSTTYFDSVNGWASGFGGAINVQMNSSFLANVPDGSSTLPVPTGLFNSELTSLISITNEFDSF